jgi:hypothetical protein
MGSELRAGLSYRLFEDVLPERNRATRHVTNCGDGDAQELEVVLQTSGGSRYRS